MSTDASPGEVSAERDPLPSCLVHGRGEMSGLRCAACERDAVRASRQMRQIWIAAGVVLLAVAGVAATRWQSVAAPPTYPITVASGVAVGERHAASAPMVGPSATSESDRVLHDWQLELARAEAKRNVEIAEEKRAEVEGERQRLAEAVAPPAEPSGRRQTRAPSTQQIAPPAEDFIIIPLRVYVLQADGMGPLTASPTLVSEMPGIVEKVNRIWAAAGVSLDLVECSLADANSAAFEQAATTFGGFTLDRPSRKYARAAIPGATRRRDGFRVYLVHELDINGVYFGLGEAMVAETAHERPVKGGIHEAIPRVMAHEIGHGLGLDHVAVRTRLMLGGSAGTKLIDDEIARARATAQTFPGAHAIGAGAPPPAVAAVAQRPIAPW